MDVVVAVDAVVFVLVVVVSVIDISSSLLLLSLRSEGPKLIGTHQINHHGGDEENGDKREMTKAWKGHDIEI